MNRSGTSMTQVAENARYFFRIAHEASYKGEYLHAIEYYDHALSTDSHNASAWHEKGDCLDKLGRSEEALACYDEALRRDPHDAETWFHKGLIMMRLGRENEAYGCFNQGIELECGKKGLLQVLSSLRTLMFPQLSRFTRVLLLPAIRIIHRGSRSTSDAPSKSSGT